MKLRAFRLIKYSIHKFDTKMGRCFIDKFTSIKQRPI